MDDRQTNRQSKTS